MEAFADLIIDLAKFSDDTYRIELHFSRPDDPLERPAQLGFVQFDMTALRGATLDPETYGLLLKNALFGEAATPEVREYFKTCLALAEDNNEKLRLRVLIHPNAFELHDLRWETLRDLEDDDFLARDRDRLFSRFVHSRDWSNVRLRPKKQLRALVVVASPKELKDGITLPGGDKLKEVDVAGELQRAREALADIGDRITVLESRSDDPGRVTMDNIEESLQDGYDIFYLVCHGALLADDPTRRDSPRSPFLWLEKPDGTAARTNGKELIDIVEHLEAHLRPRLIVLASCQSAGLSDVPGATTSIDRGALAALGPRLAEVGAPAVLAMQHDVAMDTVAAFMPEFFTQLLRDGRVDRAMMEARWKVRKKNDWWAPILFLRLRGGFLWYEPGFDSDFTTWPGIVNSIKQQQCVPILGAELLDFISGSTRKIAHEWAETYRLPLQPHQRDNFPQVAQHLSVEQRAAFPRDQLLAHLKTNLCRQFHHLLPADAGDKTLQELMALIGARADEIPGRQYDLLARLPFKIYINANPDNLLEAALRAQNPPRDPQVLTFCWKNTPTFAGRIMAHENIAEPTPKRPLVYHLFGHVDDPESLILTEDDYLDYLMWVNKTDSQIKIPDLVVRAWNESALLFLGFQLSDWNFRVLFRSIMTSERQALKRNYPLISVQLQPGDDTPNPTRARQYLEKYFSSFEFDIYWGSSEDFLEALWEQWNGGGG